MQSENLFDKPQTNTSTIFVRSCSLASETSVEYYSLLMMRDRYANIWKCQDFLVHLECGLDLNPCSISGILDRIVKYVDNDLPEKFRASPEMWEDLIDTLGIDMDAKATILNWVDEVEFSLNDHLSKVDSLGLEFLPL